MDFWMPILGGIASTIALVVLILSFANRPSNELNYSDRQILEYGDGAKALVILLGTLVPILVLFLYSNDQIDLGAAFSTLGLIGSFVGYCGPEFFRTRIEYDARCVFTFSPWRKPRVIPWTVIMTCKHSALKHWSVFDTFGSGSLRVSDFMRGSEEFRAQFRKCGEEVIDYRRGPSHA